MNVLAEHLPPKQAYGRSQVIYDDIVTHLESREAVAMTHSELERDIEKRCRELMRMLLQEHIDARGPGKTDEPVVGADGLERRRVRIQKRKIESVFGTIEESRAGYGQPGVRSLHPLDAELNVPVERYSLELRHRVSEEAAKSSFDETLEMVHKTTGAHVPKRQLEELTIHAAMDFDSFYQQRHAQAPVGKASAPIVVITSDGKGIVMRFEDLREATRKAAEERKHKMGARLSTGEKKNAKRMATVASVYTIMPYVRRPEQIIAANGPQRDAPPRPRPEQKRVWASVEKAPEKVLEEAFDEARYRDSCGEKTWVALVDGDKIQIRRLRRLAKNSGVDLTIICDLVHVIEYVWKAGRVFHPESGPELESWVRHRILEILRGKAGWIAGGMRRSATFRGLSAAAREPVDKCAVYLLNHSPYLHYDRYLAQGLPVATGVIEGACRHLVKDRMDVTGAHWGLTGAEAVLRLRALRCSQDFEEYWTFHEACEYARNHANLYAGGDIPSTASAPPKPKRDHLKVLK